MFHIVLSGLGGELEHRTCFFEEEVKGVVQDLISSTASFAAGDTITVTEEDDL